MVLKPLQFAGEIALKIEWNAWSYTYTIIFLTLIFVPTCAFKLWSSQYRVTNRRQQGYTPCYGCFDYLFAPTAAQGDVWYYMYNDKRVRINGFDHVDKAAEVLKVKVKRFLMYFIICIPFYHNELHFELF